MKLIRSFFCLTLLIALACTGKEIREIEWTHLSSTKGEIDVPGGGDQQTATALFDVDGDGLNDFLIAERTGTPSVVWYKRLEGGWERYIVEVDPLHIEAGSAVTDIDGDGDLDVVFGGDAASNEVWWWENPNPGFEVNTGWRRHTIKSSGGNKHHDQIFGDFDGDGNDELVFWNQGDRKLLLAEIPDLLVSPEPWEITPIYAYSDESEPEQRGEYPDFKGVNEHEGLAKADIDGDGKLDIVGGGRWFKHIEESVFRVSVIDDSYSFSRVAAGQLVEGGRPEVVLVVGDGSAPLILYTFESEAWNPHILIDSVTDGHSLELLDFDGDGDLDIFVGEMRLGKNPEAKVRILLGDGQGGFETKEVLTGFGLHESRMADLDGDGDFDILGKPYNWETPRLDIWLQNSGQEVIN